MERETKPSSIFQRLTPRLPVPTLDRTLAFYRDRLGFRATVLWPDEQATFAILERDAASVAFFVPDPARPVERGYAELYIRVSDVRGLHAELKDRVEIEWGPEVYSYGHREFAVRDPDGYLVIFTEPTDETATTSEPG